MMKVEIICIPFVITIFGVGFPILLQVVSRLEEKYSSKYIVDFFRKEKESKFFTVFLFLSLLSAFMWLFNLPPFDIGKLTFLLVNSASNILTFSTILLIFSFFFLVKKIFIYYSPETLTNYIIVKYNKKNNKKYFNAVVELLFYSVKKQDLTISLTIKRFVDDVFSNERNLFKNHEPIKFSSYLYEFTNNITQELSLLEINKLKFLEHDAVGGTWLLGDDQKNPISELTYQWLWRNLSIAISNNKDDMVVHYWEWADQYMSFNFDIKISEMYNDPKKDKETEELNNQKSRFLEFHYALGGLLLYQKRYNCIKRLFNYTSSIPPIYELLPDTMDEIFKQYIKFRDPYEKNFSMISYKYYFPKLEGLQSDYVIKNWICSYLALLLLRQYTIISHLITMKPLELISIPETQAEKRLWIDNLDHFSNLVKEIMNNSELLKTVGFDYLIEDWCKSNGVSIPSKFVDNEKSRIIRSFEEAEVSQDISPQKEKQFLDSSKKIIKETIYSYKDIYIKKKIENDYKKYYINGAKTVIDKSAFAEDQGVDYSHYDSILAESISNEFKKTISNLFLMNKIKTYLLKHEEVFQAIDKLITNADEYIIIGFGQNIQYFLANLENFRIKDLKEDNYKNISLINFPQSNSTMVGQSFFILKKGNLPQFIHLDLKKEEISKYHLKSIDDDIKLYASIIDLNDTEELRNELSTKEQNRDLRKSVLVKIAFLVEIRWKNKSDIVQIKTYSKYSDQGLPNKLSDVKPIKQ